MIHEDEDEDEDDEASNGSFEAVERMTKVWCPSPGKGLSAAVASMKGSGTVTLAREVATAPAPATDSGESGESVEMAVAGSGLPYGSPPEHTAFARASRPLKRSASLPMALVSRTKPTRSVFSLLVGKKRKRREVKTVGAAPSSTATEDEGRRPPKKKASLKKR